MASVQESIEVGLPVSSAYKQWTQFETFPDFMTGVASVEQTDETSLQFRTDVSRIRREYGAQIIDQAPDRKIVWVSTDRTRNAGTAGAGPQGTR